MISPRYFDYAAATPLDPKALSAMLPYLGDVFYNPSADYLAAKDVRHQIQLARDTVARNLGVRSSEVYFTAGGTEANNIAINGVMSRYPDSEICCSAIEHDSVINSVKNYKHHIIGVDSSGYIDLEQLEKNITHNVALVSVMYANNEIGTIQPLKEISKLIQGIRRQRQHANNTVPLLFHADASQAGNYLSLKVANLGVDMMTINGGKIYGPKQSGVLYVRAGINLGPLIFGGGQENSLRSGTENVANIIGLSVALNEAQNTRVDELNRMQSLHKDMIKRLSTALPNLIINGGVKRLPNNVHITVPGIDNEIIMMKLDEAGFQVAVGSACSASSDEPSHVLRAIGLSDDAARSSLRITMGRFTTKEAVDELVGCLVSFAS